MSQQPSEDEPALDDIPKDIWPSIGDPVEEDS
jgi:hypothetical protein